MAENRNLGKGFLYGLVFLGGLVAAVLAIWLLNVLNVL